jgi:4'-phosphopantetheinyl transferase
MIRTALGAAPRVPPQYWSGPFDGWHPGPRNPDLVPGALHVWGADLRAVADDVLAWLSPDERERCERFAHEPSGRLWGRARGVLRALLARYLGVEPVTINFRVDGRGKPGLALPTTSTPLAFNVSHSGRLALYGLTEAGPVGVDVQTARTEGADLAVARRALGAEEARRLAALEPAQRELEFLRAWTRHEASLKCRGTGLAGSTDASVDDAGGATLWVAELDIGLRAVGAVALERDPLAVRRWSYG